MSASTEPELDLSDLLVPAPVPPDGAARAERTARRRHILRRATAAGTAIVVVIAAAVVVVSRENRPGRTVRTADAGMSSYLLAPGDVEQAFPDLRLKPPATRATYSLLSPQKYGPAGRPAVTSVAGVVRHWEGPTALRDPIGNMVFSATDFVLRFRNDQDAAVYMGLGTQGSPVDDPPGAILYHSPPMDPGRPGSTFIAPVGAVTSIVRVARGPYVLELYLVAGPPLRDEQLLGLFRRQVASLPPQLAVSCPYSGLLHGTADGLPQEGQTELAHVQRVVREQGRQIKKDFPGVTRLSVEPRNGDVWSGTNGGAYTVHAAADYWIGVHLASPSDCPQPGPAFASYDGVPLSFVVG